MKTNHAPKPPLRVGLDTYWPQFAGLKESLGRKTHKEVGHDKKLPLYSNSLFHFYQTRHLN